MTDLTEIRSFLACETPDRWVEAALCQPDILLVDHANCEKKAAATALNLLFRYERHGELLQKLSRLAREELRHFEQVLAIMQQRGIEYTQLSASRYASGLREQIRSEEPWRLIDTLIVGALIEARSCERFACLAPYLDEPLQRFYQSLLRSEKRHYQDYLALARGYAPEPIEARIAEFVALERQLIEMPDESFRFHSGPPLLSSWPAGDPCSASG